MTDRPWPLHFSTRTLYEMALLERLQQFEVTDEVLRDMIDTEVLELPVTMTAVPPEVFDTDLISRIAEYLIDIEELAGEFESSEKEHVLNIGMFIYGFTKNFPELGR